MSPNPAQEQPFKRVANELREEILRGDHAPGDKLPTETVLAERFGVARDTVRRGIGVLRTEGLVISRQGAGAFVRQRPRVKFRQTGGIYRARRATGKANFNAEVEAQGQRPKQVVREVVETPAPDVVADRFEIAVGAPVLVRRLLQTVDDVPMQLVDAYYELDLARGTRLAEPRLIRGGANALIEDPGGPIRRRIVQFIEDIDVRLPYPHEVELLDIPPGVHVAKLVRTAYDAAGEPLEVLDSVAPCDRHTFRYVIDVP